MNSSSPPIDLLIIRVVAVTETAFTPFIAGVDILKSSTNKNLVSNVVAINKATHLKTKINSSPDSVDDSAVGWTPINHAGTHPSTS